MKKSRTWLYALILVALGVIVLLTWKLREPSSKTPSYSIADLKASGVTYALHQGKTGSRTEITLPDSTTVILNSASDLHVPSDYAKGNRTVILDGDAFFDVKPGKDSFTVVSSILKATVLGTSFRMRSFASQQGATYYQLTGSSRVGKSYHSATDNQPEILERGQMVLANREIDLLEKETYHAEELETWLSDILRIQNANPMAVSRLLEDWFGVEVEMHGDASKARIITEALFFNASLEEVLTNLAGQQGFKYKIDKNKVILNF
ncbi:FecR family protein [Chitinophaga qingshengii]|uniref:FecR domain-containing protein n=1 Tax=Chitinophaga qingshengii TaxID=1569794 RepID=A0ABR7TIB6_9BACT|nr:FecR family protein [Chitinophaga qingshengii]MBC9930246.1 FecR domain-containing protein [Chitinophaga qingshengii]